MAWVLSLAVFRSWPSCYCAFFRFVNGWANCQQGSRHALLYGSVLGLCRGRRLGRPAAASLFLPWRPASCGRGWAQWPGIGLSTNWAACCPSSISTLNFDCCREVRV
eukprot:2480197-Amphidinium_carterae.1